VTKRPTAATATQQAPEGVNRVEYSPDVFGSTGLRQTGGFVFEEFLRELAGPNGARVYREMSDNDGIVGAVIFAITTLIRQAEWSVQAVDETDEAQIAKQFVEEVLDDMSVPWSTVITEVCSMFVYGFAPMEIIWKKRGGPDGSDGTTRSAYSDNRIGVRAISLRAQPTIIRWDIDEVDGSVNGFWQQPVSGAMLYIPIQKALLFRTTDERNNPEGRSILRSCYRAWYFKKRIEEIEAIGIERDLAGLPVARIPAKFFRRDADANDKAVLAAWQTMVSTIRRDQKEGIVIPSDRDQSGNAMYDLELMNSGGSRTFDTTKIIDRYNRQIATSALADFIFLGQQATGSFALSSDKTALFASAISAFIRAIEGVFNRHLLPRLWLLNGFDSATMPVLSCGDLEHANLGELSQYITSLAGAGMPLFPDRELENFLRKTAGLPMAPEEGLEGDPGQMEPNQPGAQPSDQTQGE